jgi:DNA polymerase I-like protein with 3'-5' exonuclease and polymerase domains
MTVPRKKKMQLATIDFETYYDREYSLSKITTEEYVHDDRFEVIGVSVKIDDGPTEWFSGTFNETKAWLERIDWSVTGAIAHNMMFDSAILSWRFGIKPVAYLDTLCMARAVDGVEVGNSLAKLADRYGLGSKGTEVLLAIGKRRANFTEEELAQYGSYCCNDVEITKKLFDILGPHFSKTEFKLIDLTMRMYAEPVLELDLPLLEQHLEDVKDRKEALLTKASVDKETLMSNPKFADLLRSYGVYPPTKISPTTGKATYALAKNDELFKALLEHPDERVQAVVAARLGAKSTLEETRTERLISIAKRGKLPVPLRYYAAHTGRWGGDDKLNLQNLPRKSKLKNAITAPEGYVIIDADSAQIEARVLAWLSGQADLVHDFADGADVYKKMAAFIYQKNTNDITAEERFVGKTTILGAGYGMGWKKFQVQLLSFGVDVSEGFAKTIVNTYREAFPHIPALWREGDLCLEALTSENLVSTPFGKQPQAVSLLPGVGFDFPSKIPIKYRGLAKYIKKSKTGMPLEAYHYETRRGKVDIYGGKIVENVCQGLARCIIGEQMLKISKKYRVVLTVHDAVACIAPTEKQEEAIKYVEECMRFKPKWAETLPLNCEIGVGANYGAC